MHFSTIAITLLGAAASASASIFARQTLPNCAVTCTASADLGGCVVSDTHCLCTNAAFVNSTTSCVEKSCTGADLQNALKASQDLCAKVGVTLTASGTAAPAASSAAASGSASGSANASATGSGSAASASATSPSTSKSGAAPAATSAKSSASSFGANAVFAGVAAGVVALAL